jgi:hypothetical protein
MLHLFFQSRHRTSARCHNITVKINTHDMKRTVYLCWFRLFCKSGQKMYYGDIHVR